MKPVLVSMRKPGKAKRKPLKKAKQQTQIAPIVMYSAPVARSSAVKGSPYLVKGKKGSICVRHREYLGNVYAQNQLFDPVSYYTLNPGDQTTFPWLSSLARNFAMFRFTKADLIYVPECSTATSGAVLISYSADAADLANPPSSKVEMLEAESSLRTTAWEAGKISCNISKLPKYVKIGNCYQPKIAPNNFSWGTTTGTATITDSNSDIRTLADGVIFVSCASVASGVVGDLYLDYEVELSRPVGANPVCVASGQCQGNATKLFQDFNAATNPASQMNIGFADNLVQWNTIGTVLVTIYSNPVTPFSVYPTFTVNQGTIIQTVTSQGANSATTSLMISCQGLTSLTAAGGSGASSTYQVWVVVTPIPGNLSAKAL